MASGDAYDGEFLAELRSGSEKAFERVVRENAAWTYALARRIAGCDELARDCVQEAFTSAYTKIASFEGRSSLKTWLHRIVVNHALMKIRQLQRRPEESFDALLLKFDDDSFVIGPSRIPEKTAEEMLADKQTSQFVRESIDKLPENYRTILLLRDIEGFSTSEAAQMLDIHAGAIRTCLHRARAALRTLLERLLEEDSQ